MPTDQQAAVVGGEVLRSGVRRAVMLRPVRRADRAARDQGEDGEGTEDRVPTPTPVALDVTLGLLAGSGFVQAGFEGLEATVAVAVAAAAAAAVDTIVADTVAVAADRHLGTPVVTEAQITRKHHITTGA